ncbi:YybH family protein [Rhizobium sp. RAF56]|jgi:ketosteroid isomerase-like protein|uniref:YybH family protein n=1 Tax=Rhizobium sp. RAF56 TaxID=3233062 RepID=UPI003F9A9763
MDDAETIIAMERRALVRWCKGDPSGFLEISAPDVVYFDPIVPRRLDGLEALTTYYEGVRGKIIAARFDILHPLVQFIDNTAVLTFNYISYEGNEGRRLRWNCTEVFRHDPNGWKIVQTHWSLTQNGR